MFSSAASVYTFNFRGMNEITAGGVVSVSRDSKLIQMNDSTRFFFEIKSIRSRKNSKHVLTLGLRFFDFERSLLSVSTRLGFSVKQTLS